MTTMSRMAIRSANGASRALSASTSRSGEAQRLTIRHQRAESAGTFEEGHHLVRLLLRKAKRPVLPLFSRRLPDRRLLQALQTHQQRRVLSTASCAGREKGKAGQSGGCRSRRIGKETRTVTRWRKGKQRGAHTKPRPALSSAPDRSPWRLGCGSGTIEVAKHDALDVSERYDQ